MSDAPVKATKRKTLQAVWVFRAAIAIGFLTFGIIVYGVVSGTDRDVEIAGCKSLYRSEIDDASGALEVVVGQSLYEKFGTEDDAAFADVVATAPGAIKALSDATDLYRRRIEQSIADPEGFLRNCRKDY